MNSHQTKRTLLLKIQNNLNDNLPRCPECNKRMKEMANGKYKCPYCSYTETESETPPVVEAQKSAGGRRSEVFIPEKGGHRSKKLKMRPSVMSAIKEGKWTSKQFGDVNVSRADVTNMTPYVPATKRQFPDGSAASQINQMIDAMAGVATAYYQHAMALDEGFERQCLLYKAENYLKFSNTTLNTALKSEIKNLDSDFKLLKSGYESWIAKKHGLTLRVENNRTLGYGYLIKGDDGVLAVGAGYRDYDEAEKNLKAAYRNLKVDTDD
jgi:hypothetical protein